MTETQALALVTSYLHEHGFDPNRVDIKNLPQGKKSPDLDVMENGERAFFCEVKTPLLLANDVTKMFHWSTSIVKIRGFIHKAVKQFRDYDLNHHKPWVIIFTSDHMQLNWTNMKHVLNGFVSYPESSQIIADFRNKPYVIATNNDVKTVDLYVWFQINSLTKDRIHQARFFLRNTILLEETRRIVEKLCPRPEERMQ